MHYGKPTLVSVIKKKTKPKELLCVFGRQTFTLILSSQTAWKDSPVVYSSEVSARDETTCKFGLQP